MTQAGPSHQHPPQETSPFPPFPDKLATSPSMGRPSLLTMPPEILENVAFFAAIAHHAPRDQQVGGESDGMTRLDSVSFHPSSSFSSSPPCSPDSDQEDPFSFLTPSSIVTPPADLHSLLLTCRRFHALLNISANPRLYAKVFRYQFDTEAIARRFGPKAMSSRGLSQEFRKRCICLKRMRRAVKLANLRPDDQAPDADTAITENLWLAYMMLVENDGLNMQHIKWGQVEGYLLLFHSQVMLESSIQPGYPPDTPDRALALHLTYLLTDPEQLAAESKEESEEKLFVLRPFVFAAHKFDAYHAPWTVWDLPICRTKLDESNQVSPPSYTAQQARPMPGDPFLADLNPRSRACEIEHCGMALKISSPILTQAACFSFFMKVERDPAVIVLTALAEDQNENAGDATSIRGSEAAALGPYHMIGGRRVTAQSSRSPLSFSSRDHDKDICRLLACLDPKYSPGLRPLFCKGMFEGAWEGRFSFFDFDSYREMLAGRMRSLYEGPFGEQPQVWKISERVVKVPRSEPRCGHGSLLNAGYLNRDEEARQEDSGRASSNGSAKLSDVAMGKQRAEPADYDGVFVTNDLPKDWALYPTFEDDWKSHEEDPERYEILLSGTGHSAWGKFVLRGRVRSWDGMILMTKEYRPDGRGRWLYRGYAVAGGKLVGRWRDTFTPDNLSGYEGCFLLHRREAS
ncbi:hypothetical protein IE53DRAFT_390385 [Violaceomyces palustris]|uniref:Uncharacterized protein n=1 Tax=Violaceomyces palustris TaxID=1673888 RepID=A0ACD0NNT8_9BASI|nr:hypothetical protein IE53DRAFT_390385 [Violaceomyces palustris]